MSERADRAGPPSQPTQAVTLSPQEPSIATPCSKSWVLPVLISPVFSTISSPIWTLAPAQTRGSQQVPSLSVGQAPCPHCSLVLRHLGLGLLD